MFTTIIRFHLLLVMCFASFSLFGPQSKNPTLIRDSKTQESNFQSQVKSIDIKDFHDPSSPTAGFQEAVDFLKPNGGILYVSPGTYQIRKSIVLYSGIHIMGSGEHSVIERIDSCIQQPLIVDAKQGEYEIKVNEISGFVEGGEITITSNTNTYWECTAGTIEKIKGNTIKIDMPMKHTYASNDKAVVVNFFPVFTAIKANDIQIENVSIDGRMKRDSSYHNLFICSAIHFLNVSDSAIKKVTIRNYPSDGISIQAGKNVSVTECIVEYALGNGFHPGSDLQISTWSQNIGRFNGWNGLFFCFNIRYSTFSDNKFYNNKLNGIGDIGMGGKIGDQMNVISGNYCFNNYKSGIECTSGGYNTIANNICENNSQLEPGKWHDIYLKDAHFTIVQGNHCSNSPISGLGNKKGHGIFLRDGSENNIIIGNMLSGYDKGISGDNLDRNTIENNITFKDMATKLIKNQDK